MAAKTVQASFPSNLECTVASALLLLSATSPRVYSDQSGKSFVTPEPFVSKLSGGSLIAESSVDGELSCDRPVTVVAFVPRFHELKLKIVRKKRSKSIRISDGKKMKYSKPESSCAPTSSDNASVITTVETSSCLSGSSSAQSCRNYTNAADKLMKPVISGHMGHRAEAILRVLSNGSASEVRIRQLLGDSPSTSKALRMLLKQQEVKRLGAGGRGDPYIYMIAS